ncbi:hypothetical protein OUZ56_010425 [Daphnia magna]|uniref:Uncharacterized protein n=1 Tax=Daphnia magna TaxID=35525 RepID=A0ABR0AII2_9CRUS|nr:hypothetical protein OUZ56_010425 [Daphnia magna]
MEWDWKSRDKKDNAFRAVDITLEWLQQLVERLSRGLASNRYGKNLLRPIFSSTNAGDMRKSYQETAVTAEAIENGIRLFIHIPIFEFTRALTLYHQPGLPQYLATSPAQQTFIELSTEMVGPFHPTKKSICPISRAVSRKNNKGTCSVVIFLADNHGIQDDCTVLVSPWTGQDAIYLGHRRWGLSATNTTRLVVTCLRQTTGPQS